CSGDLDLRGHRALPRAAAALGVHQAIVGAGRTHGEQAPVDGRRLVAQIPELLPIPVRGGAQLGAQVLAKVVARIPGLHGQLETHALSLAASSVRRTDVRSSGSL